MHSATFIKCAYIYICIYIYIYIHIYIYCVGISHDSFFMTIWFWVLMWRLPNFRAISFWTPISDVRDVSLVQWTWFFFRFLAFVHVLPFIIPHYFFLQCNKVFFVSKMLCTDIFHRRDLDSCLLILYSQSPCSKTAWQLNQSLLPIQDFSYRPW